MLTLYQQIFKKIWFVKKGTHFNVFLEYARLLPSSLNTSYEAFYTIQAPVGGQLLRPAKKSKMFLNIVIEALIPA